MTWKNYLVLCIHLPLSFLLAACGGVPNEGSSYDSTQTQVDSSIGSVPDSTMPDTSQTTKKTDWTAIDRLVEGRLAYDIPEEMQVGGYSDVRISVSMSKIESIVVEGLPRASRDRVVIDTIKVSSKIKVELYGSDFDIQAKSSPEQSIDDSTASNWVWEVKPLSAGKKFLKINVTAFLRNRYGEVRKDYPVYTREVLVNSRPAGERVKDFISEYWQWIIVTIIIPIISWWIKERSGKKHKS